MRRFRKTDRSKIKLGQRSEQLKVIHARIERTHQAGNLIQLGKCLASIPRQLSLAWPSTQQLGQALDAKQRQRETGR